MPEPLLRGWLAVAFCCEMRRLRGVPLVAGTRGGAGAVMPDVLALPADFRPLILPVDPTAPTR